MHTTIRTLVRMYVAFAAILLFPSLNVKAQCSVALSDTLLPNFNLQLAATPTIGVPPFTFTWSITGINNAPVVHQTISAAGDTVLVNASDLFANYGCVFISLCMTDSAGCSTCTLDTAFTQAIQCYSAFSWQELQPGVIQVTLANPPPDFLAFTIVNWQEGTNTPNQPLVGNSTVFNYNPPAYNPNGYRVPVCVQTFFFNVPFGCIACDTVDVTAIVSSLDDVTISAIRIQNPIQHVLNVYREDVTQIAAVTLFDLNGREVARKLWQDKRLELATAALTTGIYILQVETAGQKRVYKIVKE